jgi:hypothetical protein
LETARDIVSAVVHGQSVILSRHRHIDSGIIQEDLKGERRVLSVIELPKLVEVPLVRHLEPVERIVVVSPDSSLVPEVHGNRGHVEAVYDEIGIC